MFSQRNVNVTTKTVKMGTKETKDQTLKMVDCQFVIAPLTYELAVDMGGTVAQQLFRRHGTEHTPTSDVTRVGFNLKIPRQTMDMRSHPEVQNKYRIDAVDIHAVEGRRASEDPSWTLWFMATFELPEKNTLAWLCHQVNEPVALSFEKMQGSMALEDPEDSE